MPEQIHSRIRGAKLFTWGSLSQLVLALVLLVPLQPNQAQGLQTLFYSPDERTQLDRQRLISLQLLQAPEVMEQESETIVEPESVPDVIISFGGMVRQADGGFLLWLNGESVSSTRLPGYIELLEAFDRGVIRAVDRNSGTSFLVKPGQVLNLTRGLLLESYDPRAAAMLQPVQPEAGTAAAETSTAEPAPVDVSGDEVSELLQELETAREEL